MAILAQRLRARKQTNCENCDKSAKFGEVVFKITYFQFFISYSKFCRDKGKKSRLISGIFLYLEDSYMNNILNPCQLSSYLHIF